MSWNYCWGRECKPGWGYNEYLNLLIPVQGRPPNVTSEVDCWWGYDWPENLSSSDIFCKVSSLFA